MEAKHMKFKLNSDKTRGLIKILSLDWKVLIRSVREDEIKWMTDMVIKIVSPTTSVVDSLRKESFVPADYIRETGLDFSIRQPSSIPKVDGPVTAYKHSINKSKLVGLHESYHAQWPHNPDL